MVKGKYIRTEEIKEKLRLSRLGRHNSFKTEFKKGHITWNKGISRSEEDKIKMRKKHYLKEGYTSWNKGIPCSDETKIKIGLKSKGRFAGEKNPSKRLEVKQKISNTLKVKFRSGLIKHPFLGREHTQETKEKLRRKSYENTKRLWQNPEYREKVIKNALKGLLRRPTSFEKKLIDMIDKYNLPYKYVGNGSFLIGYKNPDFIDCNGKKICIEVYNNYHHTKDYEKKRSEHFIQYGWRTIFINEEEVLSNKDDLILKKLKD